MAINRRHFDGLTPDEVFAVLSDGESYGYWVVGTRAVREVSGDWPAPGAAIHYVVGRLPLRKEDVTTSLSCDPGRRLTLEAHAWPAGSLHIDIRLEPTPNGCTVAIEEGPKKGLLKTLHNPLVDVAIKLRNVETLRRLEKKTREQAGRTAPA
ncbi:MAG: SRPBCC family protein [Mycobacteriales bacterium]